MNMQYDTSLSTVRRSTFLGLACRCLLAISVCCGVNAALRAEAKAAAVARSLSQAAQKREAPTRESISRQALSAKERREAEQRLADLGYWVGKIDGQWDAISRQALIAFQKVTSRRPTGQITRAEFQALLRASPPTPREIGEPHVEIDLQRQVLFFVDAEGKVSRILPVSTGSGKEFTSEGWSRAALTFPGRFNIYMKVPGWKKGPMGSIYYPNYILGGIAIHGFPSVPTKPASHGCIRIPMFAAIEFSKLTPLRTSVIIYHTEPLAAEKEVPNSQR